jgi:hypothetical protein
MIRRVIRPFLALLAVVAFLFSGVASPPATAATCTTPRFVTSDPDGLWADGRYLLHNNMWNATGTTSPRPSRPVRTAAGSSTPPRTTGPATAR